MINNLTSTGLSTESILKIQNIFSDFIEIDKVWLYGSRAKGNFHKGSDIDLSIVSNTLNYTQLVNIENQLDDLLLPQKIDLSIFRMIENPDLTEHIKRIGIEFYKKK